MDETMILKVLMAFAGFLVCISQCLFEDAERLQTAEIESGTLESANAKNYYIGRYICCATALVSTAYGSKFT